MYHCIKFSQACKERKLKIVDYNQYEYCSWNCCLLTEVKFPEISSSLPAGVPEQAFCSAFLYRPNELNNTVTECKDVLVKCTCINVAYV